jgi:hypothetical protein
MCGRCRASLDWTAEGSRPYVVSVEHKKAAPGAAYFFATKSFTTKRLPLAALLLPQSLLLLRSESGGGW